MKNTNALFTLLLILLATYLGFKLSVPEYEKDAASSTTSFSTNNALVHVEKMSIKPHAVGFPGHTEVRQYIIDELQKMGLEPSVQEGYTAGDWANLSKATNILARIKGSEKGKALLLLSHYDSSPHSSFGASDAASGVATILEGIRAFLAAEKTPKNDIIILITDAEELGLNGASLFVKKHPWAKEVGLVLNFEARGSGGPSYMLIETNRGNGNLIKEFTKANPNYPVANSLVYSIYKMLPNDTDLTVFREEADIEGFNFAFIDDHFDYHTAQDTYERLDKKTLAHQGSYLMPLLTYFSDADLTTLKSLNEYNYFTVPFFKIVSYPFEWIWILFGLAVGLFLVLLIFGFRKKSLVLKEVLKGFLPMFIVLIVNGFVGYFSWSALKGLYPHYSDMLHGFPYNGYTYISAFVLFSIAVCFYTYKKFSAINTKNAVVAPLILWLVICGCLTAYLPGANFFVIPVFAFLASFFVLIQQEKPNGLVFVFLALPALWIFTPFVKMFPVGLGLKMMVASTLLSTLIFLLLLPIIGFYKRKGFLALLSGFLFVIAMLVAHFNSGFSNGTAKPTSLLYVYNADHQTAQWATYEHVVSDWTAQYIGQNKTAPEALNQMVISSKYGSGFTYVAQAALKNILEPKIETIRDTIIASERHIQICITPQRNVNRLEIFTNDVSLTKAAVNGIPLSDYFLKNRAKGKLVTHYISNNNDTELELILPVNEKLQLTLYEAANDLLSNNQFTIPARPKNNIPMPFILNDATLLIKTVNFE
tara:strand:+ start:76260 stop:78545 length:2286 start_codon:yes stop_codon:yes gene_type:complete